MKRPTKHQQENALELLSRFKDDKTFLAGLKEAELKYGNDVHKISQWIAGYIFKMTPEKQRIRDVHKVDF